MYCAFLLFIFFLNDKKKMYWGDHVWSFTQLFFIWNNIIYNLLIALQLYHTYPQKCSTNNTFDNSLLESKRQSLVLFCDFLFASCWFNMVYNKRQHKWRDNMNHRTPNCDDFHAKVQWSMLQCDGLHAKVWWITRWSVMVYTLKCDG